VFRINRSTLVKTLVVLLALLAGGFAMAALEDDIRARIQPHGEVCVIGDPCAAGIAVATAGSGAPKDPETVYQTYCFACHGSGVNNAPMLGNTEHWAPRIEKGMDELYMSAINGFNGAAMPPKGLCMDCSDDDLRATVDYIVGASQ
jgi:cytochrome c5